jgi:hypothetical protein
MPLIEARAGSSQSLFRGYTPLAALKLTPNRIPLQVPLRHSARLHRFDGAKGSLSRAGFRRVNSLREKMNPFGADH